MARRVEAVVWKEHKSFSVKENGEIISATVCQEKEKYHLKREKFVKFCQNSAQKSSSQSNGFVQLKGIVLGGHPSFHD